MSWAEAAQLRTALAAIASAVLGWRNNRKIEQVHIATNSLQDKLVESTRKGAEAAGALRGAAEEKAANK